MAKTQAEIDDDNRYRNRFRDGGNDEPMARHKKKVFNRATGRHEKPATKVSAKKWWGEKIAGTAPRPLRKRKADLDKKISDAGG